jgi:hypothetical protein
MRADVTLEVKRRVEAFTSESFIALLPSECTNVFHVVNTKINDSTRSIDFRSAHLIKTFAEFLINSQSWGDRTLVNSCVAALTRLLNPAQIGPVTSLCSGPDI